MSTAFTPGPWELRGLTIFERGKTGMSIGVATQHEENAKANANLMRAAPELYEELAQNADGCAMIISLLSRQPGAVAASLVGMLSIQEQSARAVLASAMSAGTAETTQIGSGLQPASAAPKEDAQ